MVYLRALAGITRDEALISALVGDLSKRHPGNTVLQQLASSGNEFGGFTFQFTSPKDLNNLATVATASSYSASLAVPEPSTIAIGGRIQRDFALLLSQLGEDFGVGRGRVGGRAHRRGAGGRP